MSFTVIDLEARRRPSLASSEPRPEVTIYRQLVEQATDGLLVVSNTDGRIVYCNPTAAALFRSTCDDLIGRPFGFPLGATAEAAPVEIFTGGDPLYVEM